MKVFWFLVALVSSCILLTYWVENDRKIEDKKVVSVLTTQPTGQIVETLMTNRELRAAAVQLSEEKCILRGKALWEIELGGGSKVLTVIYGGERLVVTPSLLVETKMGDDVFFRAALTQYLAGRGYIYFQISTKEVEALVKAGFTIVP